MSWLKNRIGKRITWDTTTCNCNECLESQKKGFIIRNEKHAKELEKAFFVSGTRFKDMTELKEGEKPKTRSKEYTRGIVVDITDMDSQLICRVFDYNGRAKEVSAKIMELLQDIY